MTYRSQYLWWRDAEQLVLNRADETGLLLAAFKEGGLSVRPDAFALRNSAFPARDFAFEEIVEILGHPTSGVVQNPHPLEAGAADDAVVRWLEDNQARVARADIDRLWPSLQGVLDKPPAQQPKYRENIGAPKKWDWEGALIELARIVDNGDVGLDAAILRERLIEWFSSTHTGDHPHRKEISKRVQRFVGELKKEV